jgi:hypothetical protein
MTVTDSPGRLCDMSQMDDFELIAERHRVMTALARLTDKYRALNQEMSKRETLRWMVTP